MQVVPSRVQSKKTGELQQYLLWCCCTSTYFQEVYRRDTRTATLTRLWSRVPCCCCCRCYIFCCCCAADDDPNDYPCDELVQHHQSYEYRLLFLSKQNVNIKQRTRCSFALVCPVRIFYYLPNDQACRLCCSFDCWPPLCFPCAPSIAAWATAGIEAARLIIY